MRALHWLVRRQGGWGWGDLWLAGILGLACASLYGRPGGPWKVRGIGIRGGWQGRYEILRGDCCCSLLLVCLPEGCTACQGFWVQDGLCSG